MPHIHEKIDLTVEVFIVHKNKVLLRMHDKYNIWCSIGGHIELDEDPIQAAHREVKEEVGLDIQLVGDIPNTGDSHYTHILAPQFMGKHIVNEKHTHIPLVYFAKSNTDEIKESESDHEKAEARWVTKGELDLMDLVPNIRFYAEEALKKLSS